MQSKSFRYSDAEFISVLLTLGYKYSHIETFKNRDDRFKVYFHFKESKDILMDLDYKFKNGLLTINILEFTKHLKVINRIIKSEVLQFRGKMLAQSEGQGQSGYALT